MPYPERRRGSALAAQVSWWRPLTGSGPVSPHGIGKVVVCIHLTAGGRMRELAGTAAGRGRVRLRLAGVLAYRDIPGVIMVIR